MKETFTDEQVEMEIKRLRDSEYVKLAKAEERVKYRRRQYMYQLRSYEKRGKKLAEQGYTIKEFETGTFDAAEEVANDEY